MEINCPMCSGCGKIKSPHLQQKIMNKKKTVAKALRKQGYSIREIMVVMKYKSPRSVTVLLESKKTKQSECWKYGGACKHNCKGLCRNSC